MNAGPVAFRLGLRGMTGRGGGTHRGTRYPSAARDRESRRAAAASARAACLHGRAMEAIRAAKREGLHVTCEVAPHHFTLTDEAIGDYDTHAKMNPPLRVEADRAAMVAALVDGTADCIATDHAPHAAHEKEQEFERAPNGITGLETALGLALRVLHRGQGLSLSRMISLMSTAPAEHYVTGRTWRAGRRALSPTW